MSALVRILSRIPASRREYSSFGGGRYFNSSKSTKSPVITTKNKSDAADSASKGSSTKASDSNTAQSNTTQTPSPDSAKPSASDAASSSEHGHERTTPGRQSLRNGATVSAASPSHNPSSTASSSVYLSGYQAPNAYHDHLNPHPVVNPKDFKIHQFFSLHRPLLLISNPPSIFTSSPVESPLFRSLPSLKDRIEDEDKLLPLPFTGLNLDGTYVGAVTGVDGDAEAARQLQHTMTMNRVGAVVDWEETLKTLGIDVSTDEERVMLQKQLNKEWEEVMMDSVKRKRKKKMKKHKLKKRRRLTRAQRIKIGR